MLDFAARQGDLINHANTEGGGLLGAAIGLVVGVVVVVLAVIFFPVTITVAVVAGAIALVAGLVMLGKSVGETAGSQQIVVAGDILDGSPTIATGPGQRRAARMNDPLKCHAGQKIADGSETVFMEGWNASRKGDGTECAGTIKDGCETVLIGGAVIGMAGTEKREMPMPWLYTWGFRAVDAVGTIAGFFSVSGPRLAAQYTLLGVSALAKVTSEAVGTSTTAGKVIGYLGDAANIGAAIAGGKPGDAVGVGNGINTGVSEAAKIGGDIVTGGANPTPRTYGNILPR